MRTIEDLLEKLTQLTIQDKISWENDGGPNIFSASLPRYKVRVWHWTDDDDISGVNVQLLDRAERILDVASADQFGVKYGKLSDFFDVARRSANNVSAIITDLESDLALIK